jgi:hypothetical protein
MRPSIFINKADKNPITQRHLMVSNEPIRIWKL